MMHTSECGIHAFLEQRQESAVRLNPKHDTKLSTLQSGKRTDRPFDRPAMTMDGGKQLASETQDFGSI